MRALGLSTRNFSVSQRQMFIQIFANVLFSVSIAMTINRSPLKMAGQIVILIAVVCNLFGLFVLV
jgi:hypothetical protein